MKHILTLLSFFSILVLGYPATAQEIKYISSLEGGSICQSGKYFGETVNGVPEGVGVCNEFRINIWDRDPNKYDKGYYIGEFSNGEPDGVGCFVYGLSQNGSDEFSDFNCADFATTSDDRLTFGLNIYFEGAPYGRSKWDYESYKGKVILKNGNYTKRVYGNTVRYNMRTCTPRVKCQGAVPFDLLKSALEKEKNPSESLRCNRYSDEYCTNIAEKLIRGIEIALDFKRHVNILNSPNASSISNFESYDYSKPTAGETLIEKEKRERLEQARIADERSRGQILKAQHVANLDTYKIAKLAQRYKVRACRLTNNGLDLLLGLSKTCAKIDFEEVSAFKLSYTFDVGVSQYKHDYDNYWVDESDWQFYYQDSIGVYTFKFLEEPKVEIVDDQLRVIIGLERVQGNSEWKIGFVINTNEQKEFLEYLNSTVDNFEQYQSR